MRRLGIQSYTRIVEDETGPATYWPSNAGLIALDGSAAIRFGTVDISPFAGVAGAFTPYLINLYDSASELLSGYLAEADAAEALGVGELLDEGGFENGGTGGDFDGGAEVDDGASDTFTGWTNKNVNDGNGDKVEATATKQAGSYAVKFTKTLAEYAGVQSGVGDIVVEAGKHYKLSFQTRGDGTVSAYVGIYDRTNGAYIITVLSAAVPGTDYVERVYYFTAPPSCIAIDLTFRCYYAGSVYVDAVSIKEVTALGADGCHVVSAKNGSTQNWASKSGSFDYNDSGGYTFDIVTT